MSRRARWLPALAIGFLIATRASAAPQDFATLEAQLSAALARHDVNTAEALWDDNLVFVFPNGRIAHKKEQLANLAAAGIGLTNENDAVNVLYEDADVAVVIVHSTWHIKETDAGDHYIATHVWVRRGNRWRLVSAQVARVKP